jgi:hypothetical protein
MTDRDHREAARRHIRTLISLLSSRALQDDLIRQLVDELESLERAVAAFHLEAIRFRMFNVDRLLSHSPVAIPDEVGHLFADARHELEAAGFHTRSHQAPS